MEIILNSAYHLENVIEDALDMSRIENNKFEINMCEFWLKDCVQSVVSIMEF